MRALTRILPATGRLHGQRFVIRDGGRLLATPLLLALIAIETTDVIFAIDSIPAILAVTTGSFVVYTSNVFALLGMRALYFLLAGAAARFRYLPPGLAIILAAVAAKLLLADVYEFPAWASPAFIAAVLAAVVILSVHDARRRATKQPAHGSQDRADAAQPPEPALGTQRDCVQGTPARDASATDPRQLRRDRTDQQGRHGLSKPIPATQRSRWP